MSDKATMEMLRRAYTMAQANKGEDRITKSDVDDAKKVVKTRMIYETAKKDKGEDRVTQADIQNAKKLLNFSGGGEVEVGKGGDYIKDLID